MTSCHKNYICRRFIGFWIRFLLVTIYQGLGWLIFTYTEEGFVATDCIWNQESIVKRLYRPINETEIATDFYATLLSRYNRSFATPADFEILYMEFQKHFNVKNVSYPEKKDFVEFTCFKWFSFTTVTLTTIGYGHITPKTDAGKLCLVFYAMVGIPLMLYMLNYLGKSIKDMTNCIIKYCSRKLGKKNEEELGNPRDQAIKTTVILFIILWLLLLTGIINLKYYGLKDISFIDSIYFYFVTYSTIGYGDITSPIMATDIGYAGISLLIGLSILSALIELCLDLLKRPQRQGETNKRNTRQCCCCISISHKISREHQENHAVGRFRLAVKDEVTVSNSYENTT